MAVPSHFIITGYEIGARQKGRLQYLDGTDWVDLGNWVANETVIVIDSVTNPIPIDYDIFQEGVNYCFRLIDDLDHPISNVICFTFPNFNEPLLNIDGTPLLNVDDEVLINV